MTEQEEIYGLKEKRLRLVRNNNRAKKLRNRGEYIWWSNNCLGWLWCPNHPLATK